MMEKANSHSANMTEGWVEWARGFWFGLLHFTLSTCPKRILLGRVGITRNFRVNGKVPTINKAVRCTSTWPG